MNKKRLQHKQHALNHFNGERTEKNTENGDVVAYQKEEYEGLIPHPRLMAEWERLVPGSAESIFERFHAQSEHRMRIENTVVRANNFTQYAGPVFAFVVSMTALVGGIIVAMSGLEKLGGTLSLSGLATLVGPFLYSVFRKEGEGKKE